MKAINSFRYRNAVEVYRWETSEAIEAIEAAFAFGILNCRKFHYLKLYSGGSKRRILRVWRFEASIKRFNFLMLFLNSGSSIEQIFQSTDVYFFK